MPLSCVKFRFVSSPLIGGFVQPPFRLAHTDSRRIFAMRVCQPGPVAFQRAKVSGANLKLIATFESADLGRPRGLSMAAAVLMPNISGKASLAGRAFAIIAAVHSGLIRADLFGLVGLDGFFIPVHLAFIGFTQTDDPRLAMALGKKTTLCRRSSIKPGTQ